MPLSSRSLRGIPPNPQALTLPPSQPDKEYVRSFEAPLVLRAVMSIPLRSLGRATLLFLVVALLLGLVLGLVPANASAEVSARLGKLSQLRDDVTSARGPFAYAALRKLWREWDQGNPAEVEEILSEVASDGTLAAPTRAYAGLLGAYARRRRGDLEGARARIARLGYVDRWMVLGAFDNEGKAGLDKSYGPEDEHDPPSLTRTYTGKERSVRWRMPPSASPYGWVDLGVFLRPTERVCGYVSTYVRDKDREGAAKNKPRVEHARPISLWAGSAGAMRVFWNGTEIIRDTKYRDLDAERFAARVTLEPGNNHLLVKVCGEDNAPILSLRVAGPTGAPDADVTVDANPDPASQTFAPYKGGAQKEDTSLDGPVQAFERLTRGSDPAILEAYARYLVITQSDDSSEHKARELVGRAAERAPTIPRLLLAGGLAEGRNQRGVWLDKADEIVRRGVGTRDDKLDVLLARAAYVRGGSNWRDAVPLYDRVLATDPDNVAATLARFELFSLAGLRETALALLQRALARRPESVALLRAMAATLVEEDRTTEAAEMEDRYEALRFDDPTLAKEHIELAIARRDREKASRWVDRLLATTPDSAPALGVAAHTYLAFGDRPRAIAMYRRALELAPEDTESMRALSEVYGIAGQRDEQVSLLRQIVTLLPQSKDVREYLAHLEPQKPRADEAYARPSAEFLKLRSAPSDGHNRRDLVDLTVTTVFPNGLASHFHQIVYQPMTESAAADGREYAFGFSGDTETVQLRGSRVYRANGEIDQAIESGESGADNEAAATYTSSRVFYVHFPRLNPGDVVELLYRVEDVAQNNAFADYFGEVNYMQSDVPLAHAEYVLITPKSRKFFFNDPKIPGLVSEVKDAGEQHIYRYVAENVPPIDPEAGAPPHGELLGHVHVSTYKSWDDMATWYWGLVKDQFVADAEVRRRVAEATKGITDPRAKVRAIYDYVVQKTRYVALEFGIHGFKPYSCAQIFARGFGDCKDKATLIVTMLKEAGIPATIVIVRTGVRGDFETAPASLAPFDHAIAYVPSLDLYLDGTAEYTGSTELPTMDRGALALQVNEGHAKLVHLPDAPASESVLARKVDVTLGGDGVAQVDWKADVTGALASSFRARYHADASRKQRLAEDLAGELGGLDIATIDAPGLDDVEQPVSLHVRAKAREVGRKDGTTVSLPSGSKEHFVREFAPLSQRKLDVRIPFRSKTETEWTVHVAPGTQVTRAPLPARIESPFGSVVVTVENATSSVTVKTSVSLDRSRVAAKDYPAFRTFCENADRALGQRIVIGK
jgi:cellulose synthase operon protein C